MAVGTAPPCLPSVCCFILGGTGGRIEGVSRAASEMGPLAKQHLQACICHARRMAPHTQSSSKTTVQRRLSCSERCPLLWQALGYKVGGHAWIRAPAKSDEAYDKVDVVGIGNGNKLKVRP